MSTRLARLASIAFVCLLILTTACGSQALASAGADRPNDDQQLLAETGWQNDNQQNDNQQLYLPLIRQKPFIPSTWKLYSDPIYQFRFVVPEDWVLENSTSPFNPAYLVMAHNIPDNPFLPHNFDDPAWPADLFKIEFVTYNKQPVDTALSFEQNARLILESESDSSVITGFSENPAYRDGMMITLENRENQRQSQVYGIIYPSGGAHYLMVVAVYPKSGWDNPMIQFIVNSLDY